MTGAVAALWRYPVKSFQGAAHDALHVTSDGIEGDRRWALTRDGKPLSAKRVPELLFAGARLDGETLVIDLPHGHRLGADDPSIDARLSTWLGYEVALAENSRTRWVDDAPVHLLSTSSLAAMQGHRRGDWNLRRFRPNIVVTLDGGGALEESWVGHRLRVGAVRLEVRMRTVRCVMTTHAQPGLPEDSGVFTTLGETADTCLGVYAEVLEPGTVTLGDRLTVEP